MEIIGVKSEEYQNVLINTVFSNLQKPHPFVLFLQELAKNSDASGKCLRFEVEPIIKEKLKITKGLFQKTLDRLKAKNHIIIVGYTIYLNPSYVNAKKVNPLNGGDGLFIISTIKK